MLLSKGINDMIIDKSYKVSAFGSFADIVPTSDNIMFFLEKFQNDGLITSLAQELVVQNGVPGAVPVPMNRIALLSNNGEIQIVIGTNRIDYSFTVQQDAKLSQEELSAINKSVVNFYKIVFQKYNKLASRLALNTESLMVDLSEIDMQNFFEKYSNPLSLYNGVLDEFNAHYMARKNICIPKEETLNVITNISKTSITKTSEGKELVSSGFILHTDINTIAENVEHRFDDVSFDSFLKEANGLWELIVKEVG